MHNILKSSNPVYDKEEQLLSSQFSKAVKITSPRSFILGISVHVKNLQKEAFQNNVHRSYSDCMVVRNFNLFCYLRAQ